MAEKNGWDDLADFLLSPLVGLVGGVVWLVTGMTWDSAALGTASSIGGLVLGVAIRAARGSV